MEIKEMKKKKERCLVKGLVHDGTTTRHSVTKVPEVSNGKFCFK